MPAARGSSHASPGSAMRATVLRACLRSLLRGGSEPRRSDAQVRLLAALKQVEQVLRRRCVGPSPSSNVQISAICAAASLRRAAQRRPQALRVAALRAGSARTLLRRWRGAVAAPLSVPAPYATLGSNPGLAGRVPGKSATHAREPRLGQAAAAAAPAERQPTRTGRLWRGPCWRAMPTSECSTATV